MKYRLGLLIGSFLPKQFLLTSQRNHVTKIQGWRKNHKIKNDYINYRSYQGYGEFII